MKTIELTQGQVALVDDEDFEWLSKWKWCADKTSRNGNYYAARYPRKNENRSKKYIRMHREILGAKPCAQGDHRDGNGLNNCRDNLRVCTHAQNQQNKRISKKNTSGFKGVHWHSLTGKWRAQIKANGKRMHLGLFANPVQAAHAYDAKAKELFGEFAKPNFTEASNG